MTMAAPFRRESKAGLDKNHKYDRQLRLWGDHGQASLEAARVCLINATATGTETLKNLILPGIGSFTIVDGHKITGEDMGNNFFIDREGFNKPRAQVARDLLQELNEDVSGDWVEESVDRLLDNNPEFFLVFSCVITTDLPEKSLLKLGDYLWDHNIPLLVCRSYGLIGYLRLVVKEHTVIESHPDNAHGDLRLDRPFQGLVNYCSRLNLDTMSKKDHSHTPQLVILYKYLEKWKLTHGGAGPKNYKEKNEFKELIRSGVVINDDGVPMMEENFEEAIKAVNTSLLPTHIPSDVQKVFNDEECNNLSGESKPFWILARAVKEFVEKEGQGALPLRGTIPDMFADSEKYVQLQNVYRSRASEDAATVTDKVHQILQHLAKEGSHSPRQISVAVEQEYPQDCISDAYVRLFCKNAAFLRAIHFRSLSEEYTPQTAKVNDIGMNLEDTDNNDVVFYVLLRAVDRFYSENNRYPGYYDDQVESDVSNLKTCVSRLLQEWGLGPNIKDDYVHEMCRYGASELHSVASFVGGVAAQECIKIITGQFIPLNNTYIYNAMKQTSTSIEL